MDEYQRLAAQLLSGPPGATFRGSGSMPGIAVWVAHLYGYELTGSTRYAGKGGAGGFLISFTRNDQPEARRRAAWMRDPAADPTFPPPGWGPGGSYAFRPPGWAPGAVLPAPPADQLVDLAAMAEQPHDGGLVPEPSGDTAGIAAVWVFLVLADAFAVTGWARHVLSLPLLAIAVVLSVGVGLAATFGIRKAGERQGEQAERARGRWTGPAAGARTGVGMPVPPPPPGTIAFPDRPRGNG